MGLADEFGESSSPNGVSRTSAELILAVSTGQERVFNTPLWVTDIGKSQISALSQV